MVSLDTIAGLLVVLIIIVLYDIILHISFSKKLFSYHPEKLLSEPEKLRESFIEDVAREIKQDRERNKDAKNSILEVEGFGQPKIAVIGCGGAGNNIVNSLYKIGIEGVDIIAIDSDKINLDKTQADKKILTDYGIGVGGFPELGRRAVELSRERIAEVLDGADLVFITASMGGGTGTVATPVIAQMAREQGALVIAIVTSPFRVEHVRYINAEEGIEKLKNAADTVVVLDFDSLLENVKIAMAKIIKRLALREIDEKLNFKN